MNLCYYCDATIPGEPVRKSRPVSSPPKRGGHPENGYHCQFYKWIGPRKKGGRPIPTIPTCWRAWKKPLGLRPSGRVTPWLQPCVWSNPDPKHGFYSLSLGLPGNRNLPHCFARHCWLLSDNLSDRSCPISAQISDPQSNINHSLQRVQADMKSSTQSNCNDHLNPQP